ncbi:MAG: hypothetical protein H6718_14490 [Polyangiaceae bacterium]|nr:hypothetical protein [Myxococcales bacterium]MCB9586605.1 hypothetical protein [Polyangiaceae bacterium]MCB9606112.1 hypothetical protein [Polyangiaceae bacterium]
MKSSLVLSALLVTSLALAVLGCARTQPPRAATVRPIIGPDGSQMLHVSCAGDEGLCYQAAGEACPGGYDVGRTHSVSQGNFFVRCRPPSYSDAWSVRGGAAPSTPLPAPPATATPPATTTAPPGPVSPSASAPVIYPRPGEFDVGY